MARWQTLRHQVLVLLIPLMGCNGTQMLKKGDQALEFSTKGDHSVHGVDGATINLSRLRAQGPVLLVFLRGFS